MKAPIPARAYTAGTLADPAFKYRRSYETDVRRTIDKARRELARTGPKSSPAPQADMFNPRAQVAA